MAGVIRVSFNTVLTAIRTELVAFTHIPKPRVLVIAPRGKAVPNFQADRVIFLRPGRFFNVTRACDGAGRLAPKVTRYLEVIPRVRRQTDEANTQRRWLQDGKGYFALEEQCLDCLQLFAPEDADSNWLLYEPMRLVDGAEPGKDLNDRTGWGDGSLRFEVSYLLNVNLARAL